MNSPAKSPDAPLSLSRGERASTRAYGPAAAAGRMASPPRFSRAAGPVDGQSAPAGELSAIELEALHAQSRAMPRSPPHSHSASAGTGADLAPVVRLAEATTPAMTHTSTFPSTPQAQAAQSPMTPQAQTAPPTAAPSTPQPVPAPIVVPANAHRAAQPSTPAAAPASAQPAPGHHHHHHHHTRVQKRTSVGPWDFVKSVGAGSMGQVKLAVNRYTRQSAAVKIVPKAFTQKNREGRESNEAKDARVIREAAIGKLVHHPNISRLFEVYSMSSHYYLVFEYIAGGQMLDYIITHGSVKETQARRFARSIASALDYCHRNSIVHRDLKIENILIADGGDIKIIDFGLSNLFRRDNLLKTFCGSLYFAAPELLNALPYVGPEVDVWSFGVVLYVLVCGKVPFEDKSMAALHAKIKRGEVDYPTWLSPQCTDLLSRMLVVSPSERATMREVIYHPWMNKGFDSVVESHVPERVPLELPLDGAVLAEMTEMSLATDAAALRRELESVLQSPQYLEAVAAWYDARASASALPSSAPDPLNSYHPSISMYLLTHERLLRESAISSVSTLVVTPPPPAQPATAPASTPAPVPATPMRARSVERRNLNRAATTAGTAGPPQGTPRRVVTGPAKAAPLAVQTAGQPTVVPAPAPAAAVPAPSPAPPPAAAPAGRLRSRTVGTADQALLYPEFAGKGYQQQRYAEPTPPVSPQVNADRRGNLSSLFRRISLRRRSGRSESTERPGDLSVDGLASQQSSREPSRDRGSVRRMPSRHSGNSGELAAGMPAQPPAAPTPATVTPTTAVARPARVPGHLRAKSMGTSVPAETVRPTHSRQASQLSESIEEEMPSIESPRQVSFKGFFSVQSTSTKPLREIRAEIIRVLSELAIDYVEIKGGFACIHGASLSSTGAATLPVSVTSPRQPAHRRGPSFGAGSPHASPLRASDFSTSSSDSVELTGSDMLGNESTTNKPPSPVRFEICIVRVPLLALHGVQFKKLTGDVWRYKSIAQEILEHLKL